MFGRNSKVNLELNREVEKLIKTGGKEQLDSNCKPEVSAAVSAYVRQRRCGIQSTRTPVVTNPIVAEICE